MINKYFVQMISLSEKPKLIGDFNEDGTFSILDATAIQMKLAKK